MPDRVKCSFPPNGRSSRKRRKGASLIATSRVTEASGADPGETVAAMSRALARLSREIAQKVQGSALREPGEKN